MNTSKKHLDWHYANHARNGVDRLCVVQLVAVKAEVLLHPYKVKPTSGSCTSHSNVMSFTDR